MEKKLKILCYNNTPTQHNDLHFFHYRQQLSELDLPATAICSFAKTFTPWCKR